MASHGDPKRAQNYVKHMRCYVQLMRFFICHGMAMANSQQNTQVSHDCAYVSHNFGHVWGRHGSPWADMKSERSHEPQEYFHIPRGPLGYNCKQTHITKSNNPNIQEMKGYLRS